MLKPFLRVAAVGLSLLAVVGCRPGPDVFKVDPIYQRLAPNEKSLDKVLADATDPNKRVLKETAIVEEKLFWVIPNHQYERMDPYQYVGVTDPDLKTAKPLYAKAKETRSRTPELDKAAEEAVKAKGSKEGGKWERLAVNWAKTTLVSSQADARIAVRAAMAAKESVKKRANSAKAEASAALLRIETSGDRGPLAVEDAKTLPRLRAWLEADRDALTAERVEEVRLEQLVKEAKDDAAGTKAEAAVKVQKDKVGAAETKAGKTAALLAVAESFEDLRARSEMATSCVEAAEEASKGVDAIKALADDKSVDQASASQARFAREANAFALRAIANRAGAERAANFSGVVVVALGPAEAARNELQTKMITLSDQDVEAHLSRVTGFQITFNTVTGALAIGTSAAATVTSGGASQALAVVTTGLLGAKALLNEEVYRNALVQTLVASINADRLPVRQKMFEHQALRIEEYSVDQAVADAWDYHRRGSFYEGLTLIRQAAEEANRQKIQSTKPLARRLEEIELKKAQITLKKLDLELQAVGGNATGNGAASAPTSR